jgi:hypothetical protein
MNRKAQILFFAAILASATISITVLFGLIKFIKFVWEYT